jgi:Seed maturation protein
MSQGQSKRAIDECQSGQEQGVKYGDVFSVKGDLSEQKIAPKDAAMMQAAETTVLGQTQKGGPAAVMQSASMQNERSGVVGHDQASDAPANQGVSVTEIVVPGGRVVMEFVAGQVQNLLLRPCSCRFSYN